MIATSTTYALSDDLCDRGRNFVPPLGRQGLDGTNTTVMLCGAEGRRQSAEELHHKMTLWKTKLFVNMVEHVSDQPEWLEWLCLNLNATALKVTGLFGSRATSAVCWDAAPEKGLWGYCGRGALDDECGEVVDGDHNLLR